MQLELEFAPCILGHQPAAASSASPLVHGSPQCRFPRPFALGHFVSATATMQCVTVSLLAGSAPMGAAIAGRKHNAALVQRSGLPRRLLSARSATPGQGPPQPLVAKGWEPPLCIGPGRLASALVDNDGGGDCETPWRPLLPSVAAPAARRFSPAHAAGRIGLPTFLPGSPGPAHLPPLPACAQPLAARAPSQAASAAAPWSATPWRRRPLRWRRPRRRCCRPPASTTPASPCTW